MSITCVENLSNEIFYEIFDYLDGCDIYITFSTLNNRFGQLLHCSSLLFKIDLHSSSAEILLDCSKQVRLINKHQIFSLTLLSGLYIDEFLSTFIIDSSLDRLESITLRFIKENTLKLLLNTFICLPRLFSLDLKEDGILNDLSDVYRLIFALPILKYITLSIYHRIGLVSLSTATTKQQSSTVKYLVIDHKCTLNQLATILSYTPELLHLEFQEEPEDEDSTIEIILPIITLSNLTYLSMDLNYLHDDEFIEFIPKISFHLKVFRLTICYKNIVYLISTLWKQLILQHFPKLEKFYLKYYEGIDDDDRSGNRPRRDNQFTSSFWIERQWIFQAEINHDCEIIYSIYPYKKTWYDSTDSDINSMVSVQQKTNCVFSTLTIDEEFPCENLKSLFESIIWVTTVTPIYHLEFYQRQIPIRTLINILTLLPNLDSLKVCQAYAHARNPLKRLKKKDLISLREYVINELPALLQGIEYEGNTYLFMLHPTLNTGNSDGNDQHEVMTDLLDHMRQQHLSNTTSMCHIFDVEVPIALIDIPKSSTHSSRTSSSLSDININRSQSSVEPSQSMSDRSSSTLWSILIIQLALIIIYRFWAQTFTVTACLYGFYFVYLLLIRLISKRGEWFSEFDENDHQVLGTNYRSFFGDLPAIQANQNGYFLNDLHTELNHPRVYRIWMGPEPALMLAHPQAVKEFWSQHDEKCVGRSVHLGWPLEMLMGNGVGFRSISERNRITKFFHSCFGASQVRHFDEHLETIITNFFNQHSSDILQSQDIKYLAQDAAVPLFLGEAGFDHLNELHALVDELGELMSIAFNARWTNLPFFGYYLPPTSYKLRKRIQLFNQRIRNVLTKIIEQYKETSMEQNDNDNMSIVGYFARQTNPTITFEELADTIVEGLLAPNDGTAGTFMYTLLLLAMYPEIQKKTREEILTCTNLSLKSLKDIGYLDQILSECQRLLPIFMFNVPEFSSKAMTVGGIHIPKNTMVMLDVVSLNHNQDVWESDALSFCPERFAAPVSPATLKSYYGFGNGHLRRCLGQYLVKNLHRLFLAHLLTQKQIRLTDEIKNINNIGRCRLPFIYVLTQTVRMIEL